MSTAQSKKQLKQQSKEYFRFDALAGYAKLMRLNRPIGIYLVMWPTLWALWLAAEGLPRWDVLVIFMIGVVMMRSAGCVINDYADRKLDGQVTRTRSRPLVVGEVAPAEAIALFIVLIALAFLLVLLTNKLTIYLSLGGAALAFCYPFMKRFTRAASYAKRFAAKEACSKALGTGLSRGVFWRDMGVVNLPGGKPTLALTGGAAERLKEITPEGYVPDIHLTITDDFPLAQAIVIIYAQAK